MSEKLDRVFIESTAKRIVDLWRAMRAASQGIPSVGAGDDLSRTYDELKNSMTSDQWEEVVARADEIFKEPDKKFTESMN